MKLTILRLEKGFLCVGPHGLHTIHSVCLVFQLQVPIRSYLDTTYVHDLYLLLLSLNISSISTLAVCAVVLVGIEVCFAEGNVYPDVVIFTVLILSSTALGYRRNICVLKKNDHTLVS